MDELINPSPLSVPSYDWPVNNLQGIIEFYGLCSNATADFVDGFGPDSIDQSPAGKWCKKQMIEMLPIAGKVASEFQVPRPLIHLREKPYRQAIDRGETPKKALQSCREYARYHKSFDTEICDATHILYETEIGRAHV